MFSSFMQLDKLDSFAMMCHVVDHSLFAQVDWARNSPYFMDLKVQLRQSVGAEREN